MGSCRRGFTEGSPQAVLTKSSDLWEWRKKTTSQLPPSPPLKAAAPSSACSSSSVCSNLSPRTQMIVLDQVHKLSSLVRLFIILYHIYRPLPAMGGHHKVRPDPQHPQELPVVTTAQTWALQQGQAQGCSQLLFSSHSQGGKEKREQAKDNTMELRKAPSPREHPGWP